MPSESVKQRFGAMPAALKVRQLQALIAALQQDVELLRAQLNTHVHSGITTGASNSGAPTTTIAASALNTQP